MSVLVSHARALFSQDREGGLEWAADPGGLAGKAGGGRERTPWPSPCALGAATKGSQLGARRAEDGPACPGARVLRAPGSPRAAGFVSEGSVGSRIGKGGKLGGGQSQTC